MMRLRHKRVADGARPQVRLGLHAPDGSADGIPIPSLAPQRPEGPGLAPVVPGDGESAVTAAHLADSGACARLGDGDGRLRLLDWGRRRRLEQFHQRRDELRLGRRLEELKARADHEPPAQAS